MVRGKTMHKGRAIAVQMWTAHSATAFQMWTWCVEKQCTKVGQLHFRCGPGARSKERAKQWLLKPPATGVRCVYVCVCMRLCVLVFVCVFVFVFVYVCV
jgi:hypothetical protein